MKRSLLVFTLGAAAIALQGCDRTPAFQDKSAVLVTIDGVPITQQRLQGILDRSGMPPAQANRPEAKKQLLDNLVNQQLMVAQAHASKLDADPDVQQAVAAAADQVLAQTWLQKQLSALPRPGAKEVSDFYNAHPELFAHRRLFHFRTVSIDGEGKQGLEQEVQTQLAAGRNVDEISQAMQSAGYKVKVGQAMNSADQLPADLLEKVKGMQDGQVVSVLNGTNLLLINLVESREKPIGEVEGKVIIENILLAKKREMTSEDMVKKLRAEAKIVTVTPLPAAGK